MSEVVVRPSTRDIERAGAQFDAENEVLEEALRELFAKYPKNTEPAHVLLKVTVLNTLYSTQIPLYSARIPTIFDVCDHVVSLDIDSELDQGADTLVSRVATVRAQSKAPRFYYSFATKYCNWHRPASYPIFDSRVVEYLWCLRKLDYLSGFHQVDLWDFPKFKGIVEEFRTRNGLEGFTFKQIDKFLWHQGDALLAGGKERRIEEDGTILVPVPGQPGEMEWSVENYSSPEEAELSRKKFTEPTVWVKSDA